MLVLLGVVVLLLIGVITWVVFTLRWIGEKTGKDKYFSLPLEERRALRQTIREKAKWITKVFYFLTLFSFRIPVVNFEGIKVPPVCASELMQASRDYQPTANDIFVATQMKCGTTWMQQIVFEILCKGQGDLSDDGYRHMYAVSPWIESNGSVSMEDTPLVGEKAKRIVKTHLDAELCPISDAAKYIYVARHPSACLASAKYFVTMLMNGYVLRADEFTDWFCSDDMWWGSWAYHVDGWWRAKPNCNNVLFIHYEEMLKEPKTYVSEIATFLGVDLSTEELDQVVFKSSYQYMKDNEELFEMSPPLPFDKGGGSFFVKGTGDRGKDISDADQKRVAQFCREKLKDSPYPLATHYPDVAGV